MRSDSEVRQGTAAGSPDVDVKRVRAVLALGGVPFDDLEDGVQEVRLKLLAANDAIRNPGAWAAVAASRVAVDWHRARTRESGLRHRLAARWQQTSETDLEEDRVLALTVANGMEALTAPQRQVLVLRYYVDLTVKDIAHALDVPEGTVKSRLHAALAALRTRLSESEAKRDG